MKIHDNMKHATVITIINNLLNISKFDRIAVVENGKVVQYNHPFLLMTRREDGQILIDQKS